jgi:hypothetical protein
MREHSRIPRKSAKPDLATVCRNRRQCAGVEPGMAVVRVHWWATIVLAAAVLIGSAGPAAASCVLPPRTSPAAFTGTVTAVANDGRVATVRTDDGRVVEVVGTPDLHQGAGRTSVDRRFDVGVRYQFHPLNDTSPYQDNACTATRPIGAAAPATGSPAPPPPTAVRPAGVHRSSGIPGWVVPTLAIAGTALVLSAVVAVRVRIGPRRNARLRYRGAAASSTGGEASVATTPSDSAGSPPADGSQDDDRDELHQRLDPG